MKVEDFVIADRLFSESAMSRGMDLDATQKTKIGVIKDELRRNVLERKPVESCFMCGGDSFLRLATFDRYRLPLEQIACKRCSLIHASPTFTDDAARRFYSEHYRAFQEGGRSEEESFHKRFDRQAKKGGNVVNRFSSYLGTPSEVRLVEVGCGGGGVVKAFKERGYDIVGYDIDATHLKYGREQYGLPLINEPFAHDPSKQYQGVILRHVLEHVVEPESLLSLLRKSLAPDGKVYVEVPGILRAAQGKYQYDVSKFFVIQHVVNYSLETLVALMQKCGFRFLCGDEEVFGVFEVAEPRTPDFKGIDSFLATLKEAEAMYKKNYLKNRVKGAVRSLRNLLVG